MIKTDERECVCMFMSEYHKNKYKHRKLKESEYLVSKSENKEEKEINLIKYMCVKFYFYNFECLYAFYVSSFFFVHWCYV